MAEGPAKVQNPLFGWEINHSAGVKCKFVTGAVRQIQ
jgi:hypothetical protein